MEHRPARTRADNQSRQTFRGFQRGSPAVGGGTSLGEAADLAAAVGDSRPASLWDVASAFAAPVQGRSTGWQGRMEPPIPGS